MAISNLQMETRECAEHGSYLAMLTPAGWGGCAKCGAERWREETAQAVLETTRQAMMVKANIPPRFIPKRLANYQPTGDGSARALRIAEAYAGDFAGMRAGGQGLIFTGDVGTGKTHLAIGIVHQALALGYSARYEVLLDVIRSIKDCWRKDSQFSASQMRTRFEMPDLLVLDEVDVQYSSESEKIILFEVMNTRYNQLKPTILISNMARDALAVYLGDRVMDRMREGAGRMVIFDWASHRRVAQ